MRGDCAQVPWENNRDIGEYWFGDIGGAVSRGFIVLSISERGRDCEYMISGLTGVLRHVECVPGR